MTRDPIPQADGDPRETNDMDSPLEQGQDIGRGDSADTMEGHVRATSDRGMDTQGSGGRDYLMSREQDAAIRLLQRQVKALQDYIDASLPRIPGGAVGVNWPT